MKREGLWLGAIIVLVALSVFAIFKLPTRYGLDIRGGARAVLQAQLPPGQTMTAETRKVLLDAITRRANSTGVAEPIVQPKGDDQFIVELPNATNKDQVIQEIGTTANMELRYFKQVVSERNPNARFSMNSTHNSDGSEVYSFTDKLSGQSFRDQAQIVADFDRLLAASEQRPTATPYTLPASLTPFAPNDRTIYFDNAQTAQANALGNELAQFNNFLAGTDLVVPGSELQPNSTAQLDATQSGGPVVDFSLKPDGAQKFADFTSAHSHEIMAIMLDNRVITAPNVNEPIRDGSVQISGGFKNLDEAVTLSNLINAGALPVPLKIVQNESVEATLGGDAVKKMATAGIVGLALVLVFMAAYYLLPGLVADVALLIYAVFTLAVFKGGLGWFVPAVTLTLPGIAGFILSVGMAVDANILIFERLKEELRNGKPLRAAIDSGFKRAFSAIRDSNICTIITCTILYVMGTPTVKGFALTLGLGVAISLFTAITVTRTFLYLLVDGGAAKHPEWFGLGRQWLGGTRFREGTNVAADSSKPQLNIIKRRKGFYGLSLAIIVPGIIFWTMGGLKRSIEFTGGTQVAVTFNTPVSQSAINQALNSAGLKDHLVQMANGGKLAYISIKSAETTEPAKTSSALVNPLMGRAEADPAAATSSAAKPTTITIPATASAPVTVPAGTTVLPTKTITIPASSLQSPQPVVVTAKPTVSTPATSAPAATAPAAITTAPPAPASTPTAPIVPAPAAATPVPAPVADLPLTTSNSASAPNAETNDYLKIAFASGPNAPAPITSPVAHPALDSLGVPYTMQSHSLVGGVISAELTENAFQAVIVAAILIVLYMAMAFSIGGFVAGLRFGFSAIAALLHDVLVLIGAFAILGYFLNWEIDSLFITATLTVVGFSVHDTIVIFDRLRENLRHRLKGESFEDLANRSILQSFARSINTSFTVILCLLSMLFLGEPSTRLLVAALLIGIISGTYSSIFNATPILVDWEMWIAKRRSDAGLPPVDTGTPPPPIAPRPIPAATFTTAAPRPLPTSNGDGPSSPKARPPRGGATKRF